jgi:hypothetical protein
VILQFKRKFTLAPFRRNLRHGRSGTLWQGRFKSCLVDSDAYLLAVLRYIESNPLRAAMVDCRRLS